MDALLLASTDRHPDRPALVSGERELTYRDLSADVDRLAGRLDGLAGEGDRVAVVASNAPALVVAMFAAWRAGAAVVPLNARLREYELRHVLADAMPAAIVSIASHQGYSFADLIPSLLGDLPTVRGCVLVDEDGQVQEEVAGASDPERRAPLAPEVAAVLYTSGTTGAPKGALVTHGCAEAGARALADRLELSSADECVLVIPASHAFGLGCLGAALAAGACTVLVEGTFSLGALLDPVKTRGAGILHGSPALFARVLRSSPAGMSGVRTGLVAGAPCPPALLEQLDDAGPRILNVFGMTEIGAASACRADDPAELRHSTVGRPLPGYEFRVVHPQGVAGGEPGEIQVRGPHVTPGYLDQPKQTAEAFDDGWFRTGDLGTVDEDGYVRIAGRAKELVNVAGFNVFPAEVEGFLLTHPDVAQTAVVGVPHEQMGEALEAFVVARPGAEIEPAALLRFARARIAGYKLPYMIRVVSELPLLPSGKPDRKALTALVAAGGREPAAAVGTEAR